MKKNIQLLLSIIILCSCNIKHPEDKKTAANNNPYPSAAIYYEKIQNAEKRIQEIGSMKIESPQSDDEYRKNDSLMNLEGIALDNFIQSFVDAYGNIPTDSIFEKFKNYGGYIPPVLVKKIQQSDWSTTIGKSTKKNYDQFLKYYEQFNSLIGLSLCDSKIMLKSEDGEEADLCEVLLNGTYLVDIWASWCSPCRSFNRNFKKNYNYFKNQGIETISISTDKNIKNYHLAAMRDDVPWSDFHDYTEELSKTLNIQSLPFQFIVKDGKIIKILFAGATENQLREYIESIEK